MKCASYIHIILTTWDTHPVLDKTLDLLVKVLNAGFISKDEKTRAICRYAYWSFTNLHFQAYGKELFSTFESALQKKLIEIKSSTGLKSEHIKDAAIQAYVIQSQGIKLSSVSIGHINNRFVYQGNSGA